MNYQNNSSPSTPVPSTRDVLAYLRQITPEQMLTHNTHNITDLPLESSAVKANTLVKQVSFQRVWDKVERCDIPMRQSRMAAEHFDKEEHIPVDFLSGPKNTTLLKECEMYSKLFLCACFSNAMSVLLCEQQLTAGSGSACVTITYEK